VKLAAGKDRTIQHMMVTTFWHPDGTPMSAQQFMELLFGKLPDFFQSEAELRALWGVPDTRAKLLAGLADKGFGRDALRHFHGFVHAGRGGAGGQHDQPSAQRTQQRHAAGHRPERPALLRDALRQRRLQRPERGSDEREQRQQEEEQQEGARDVERN